MSGSIVTSITNTFSHQPPRPIVLQDFKELVGTLEDVQPWEDGLVKVRVAGVDRLVPDELQSKLTSLRGRFVSILRCEGYFGVEVRA